MLANIDSAHYVPQASTTNLDAMSVSQVGRARLRHYAVSFADRSGNEVGSGVYSLDCSTTHREVTVPVWRDGNSVLLGVQKHIATVAALRRGLPVIQSGEQSLGETDSATQWILPELRWEHRLPLGGEYLPSAGSAIETVQLSEASVVSEQQVSALGITFVAPQHVINSYFAGHVIDLHLMLAALRIADRYHLPLALPNILTRHRTGAAGDCAHIISTDASGVTAILCAPPRERTAPWIVRCTEVDAPPRAFMQEVTVLHTTGDHSTVLMRKGIDAVDVGCYRWEGDRACLILKRGMRPSLPIRSLVCGDDTSAPAVALEGIAESLEGEQTIDDVALRAAQGVREEAGIAPVGTPRYVGSVFPGRDRWAERVFNCFVEVDCQQRCDAPFTVDERLEVFSVPAQEVIALCDRGIIHDPRLEINARLLNRFQETNAA